MKVFLKIILFGILNCVFGQDFHHPTGSQYQPRSNQPQYNQNQLYPSSDAKQINPIPIPYQTSPYFSQRQNPATSVRLDPSAHRISAHDEEAKERYRLLSKSKEIASRKCEEYKKLSGAIVAAGLSARTLPENYVYSQKNCKAAAGLVTGGGSAQAGDFPHMAAIGFKKSTKLSFECGGSLISETFVISAAHCKYATENRKPIEASIVRLGCISLSGSCHKDIEIESFLQHEFYDVYRKKNDIALVQLKTSLNLIRGGAIRPACLWTEEISQNKAIASGWGGTGYNVSSDDLLKVELDIFDNKACTKQYPEFDLTSNTQICVGDKYGTRDTCQGDSGGPLQIIDPENKCVSIIIGMTSHGSEYCGSRNTRAVYARIPTYIDWIVPKVWEESLKLLVP